MPSSIEGITRSPYSKRSLRWGPALTGSWSFLPPLLLYAASLAITSPVYFGDSLYYARDVLGSREPQASVSQLWEFGHLLWRPLGALIAPLALALTPDSWAWTPLLKVTFGMLSISAICGAVLVLLLYDLIRGFVREPWQRMLLITAFIWTNPVLGYSRSATSYIPALMFLTAALWCQLKMELNRRSVWLTTLALSAAVLLWFPTILAVPAVASGGALQGKRRDWVASLQIVLLTGVIVTVIIGIGGWLAGLRSAASYLSWIRDARHDLNQNRQWLRAIGGVSHLLFEPSNSGIHLKRFLLRDPYNPVSIPALMPVTLSRIGAAYVLFASAIGLGVLSRRARPLLTGLALTVVPLFLFAIFLFEPSASERFLPALPLLFLTLAAGWSALGKLARPLKVAAVLALLSIPVTNFVSFVDKASVDFRDAKVRLAEFRREAGPRDLLVTVTFDDPLVRLIEQHPFNPANRPNPVATYQVVAIASSDAGRWRENFAARIHTEWERDHEVWISKSLLSSRPAPYVAWVEGDSPAARWQDYCGFYAKLSYDRETGGPDGFARLARAKIQ